MIYDESYQNMVTVTEILPSYYTYTAICTISYVQKFAQFVFWNTNYLKLLQIILFTSPVMPVVCSNVHYIALKDFTNMLINTNCSIRDYLLVRGQIKQAAREIS